MKLFCFLYEISIQNCNDSILHLLARVNVLLLLIALSLMVFTICIPLLDSMSSKQSDLIIFTT